MSFTEQKFFILIKSNLSILSFLDCALVCICKMPLPNPKPERFSAFFQKLYTVVYLILVWSILSSFLYKVWDRSWGSFLKCACPICPIPFVGRTILHWIGFAPLSQINWPYFCGSISGLSFSVKWCMCLSFCHYHTFLISWFLELSLKIGK